MNVDVVAANFMAWMPKERQDRVQTALHAILPIYASGGEIFNVDLQNAKDSLNRSFEYAMEALPKLDYRDRSELGFGLSLYSIPSLIKKLNGKGPKASGTYPAGWTASPETLAKWKEFMAAMLPVSQILNDLKSKVVKGKKPLSPEKAAAKAAVLAKKKVRTCGCCFRPIAVLPNGLIADHGYTLPHPGAKGGSCPGRKFRPLEVSDDGLKHMVQLYTSWIEGDEEALRKAPSKTEIMKPGFSKKVEIVKKGSPEWDLTYKRYVADLENTLRNDKEGLKSYSAKLAAWKPAPAAESIGSLVGDLRGLMAIYETPEFTDKVPKGHGPEGCGPGEKFYPQLGKCIPVKSDMTFPRKNMNRP